MMRFDSRNLLIAVMSLFIIALMVLMYKVNRVVVERIPERVEPEVYVMGLSEAIERQNLAFGNLVYQARWLRVHLEKCLSLILKQAYSVCSFWVAAAIFFGHTGSCSPGVGVGR